MTTARARVRLLGPLVAMLLAIAAALTTVTAAQASTDVSRELRENLTQYLAAHVADEHVSAASLSISFPGRRNSLDVSAGTMTFGGSQPVVPGSTWQIGSNTKAFTSVLILKLEAEHRLTINDTLGRWLPQYPQWRDVTIRQLLNMTSRIPSYDQQPAFLTDYATNPYTRFTTERLVGYVVGAPPPEKAWSYSNTNYILAQMIIERVTHDTYQHQLYSRIIWPLGLRDLYYRPHLYPSRVTAREPAAYFFLKGIDPVASLVGQDVSRFSLSWTQGVGGIVATTSAMTQWERALYSDRLLPARQRAELFSLVSEATAQPIDRTTPDDNRGFGLGVSQQTGPNLGTIWTYEGGTMGVRSWHGYFPGSGLIIAVTLNSQPNDDHVADLAVAVHATLLAHHLV